ncbi:hypothetical protein AD998_01945 [bacterium 336/3]|nr:hypothetical protein AD998_01945 [bacterium 336/3]
MTLRQFAYVGILLGLILACWYLIFSNYFGGNIKQPDIEKIKNLQHFLSGVVVPIFTFSTTLLVVETFRNNTIQNIYTNVLKMIDQNRKILDGINCDTSHLENGDITSKGKDFFDDIAGKIADTFSAIETNNTNEIDEDLIKNIKSTDPKDVLITIYDYYFHIYQSDLGHYFRNLYHLVRYIDNANIKLYHKKELAKILRSHLSNYELLLLAYNCLHDYGLYFFKYVEKYDLLKSLNNESSLPQSYKKRIINDLQILTKSYPHLKKLWENNNTKESFWEKITRVFFSKRDFNEN